MRNLIRSGIGLFALIGFSLSLQASPSAHGRRGGHRGYQGGGRAGPRIGGHARPGYGGTRLTRGGGHGHRGGHVRVPGFSGHGGGSRGWGRSWGRSPYLGGHYRPYYGGYSSPYYGGGYYGPSYSQRYSRYSSPDWAAIDTDISPEEAEVYLDGEFIGSADNFDGYPDFLYLTPGSHVLEFRRDGYETRSIEIDARPGEKLDLDFRLPTLRGYRYE